MRIAFRSLLFSVLILVLAAPAFAQEFRATLTGRIVDPDGLGMPGVTVSATNAGTNEVASAVTNSEGVYSLPFLRPGNYTVSAELEGFRKYTQEGVGLQVGQTQAINITLQVGLMTETVTVTGAAPLLETTNADRGMIIDNLRVTELPLNARNPFMLSYLSPGITYNGPAIYQRPFDNGAIADWSINGGQNRNNEFLLDGAPNNSIQGGNNIAYVPPVDAVQEFKIVTNSYDAQYRAHGGRRHQRVAQVGHQQPARQHLRVRAPQGVRLERIFVQADQPREAEPQARSVPASRSTVLCAFLACTTAAARPSSCSITRDTRS